MKGVIEARELVDATPAPDGASLSTIHPAGNRRLAPAANASSFALSPAMPDKPGLSCAQSHRRVAAAAGDKTVAAAKSTHAMIVRP